MDTYNSQAAYELIIEKYKNTYKIIYKCEKCNQIHKNIMASDDNFDLIIELSKVI